MNNWQPIERAPKDTLVLILWGSNASGPMGYEIGERRKGRWITQHGAYIETDGYRVFGWQLLPPLS